MELHFLRNNLSYPCNNLFCHVSRVRLQRCDGVWHSQAQVAAVASASRGENADGEWGMDFSSEVLSEVAKFISSSELLLHWKKTSPSKVLAKEEGFCLTCLQLRKVFCLDPKARTTLTSASSFSPCSSFFSLLLLASLLSQKKPPDGFTQLRNEMLSPQKVLFKAGVNVLFWPQMNPVAEHPHAPAVLFHPAKHYPRFGSASITAGWRCSLTQFCHSNLGQPQHFQ